MYNTAGFFNNVPPAIRDSEFLNNQSSTSYYIQDASFFKMDNISVGYNVDRFFRDNVKFRASLTVRNAFIISQYDGIDPEVGGGIDNGIYPRPRIIVLGFNFNF